MKFYWTAGTLTFSIIVLIFAAICCVISWRRAGRTKAMAGLEVLRMVLIAAALFTLNKPQIPKEHNQDEKPRLIVLYDISSSMLTQDVASTDEESSRALTRLKATQPFLNKELWNPVGEKMEVVFQPFSSPRAETDDSDVEAADVEPAGDSDGESEGATDDSGDGDEKGQRPRTEFERIAEELGTTPADLTEVVSGLNMKATDLNEAMQDAMRNNPNLRAIVLVSDGDWNAGKSPSSTATELRMREIQVWPVAMGSRERLPDLELKSTQAPDSTVVNKILRVPFRVENHLPKDQTFTIKLSGVRRAPPEEGRIETAIESVEKTITIPALGRLQDTIEWTPELMGKYLLRLEIPVLDEEAIEDNNQVDLTVAVKKEELRVLIVESYPRWEYRYLRNALERDPGVTVDCLLYHPDNENVGGGRGYIDEFPKREKLSDGTWRDTLFDYDVVFLGDVSMDDKQLKKEDCRRLRTLVRSHAGGLVFLPGFRGRQLSYLAPDVQIANVTEEFPLDDLYPVNMDLARPRGIGSARPARYALTETGRRSLLTRLEPEDEENEAVWNSLPGFQWYAAAINVKEGREMLVVHGNESNSKGRIPLVATGTSGTGKLLYMGSDSAWRWRKGVEDLYHYRFWGQVVRWMGYQRHRTNQKNIRLFTSPDRPEQGNDVTLNANVMGRNGNPLEEGEVIVQATAPSGKIQSIRLSPATGDYQGLFTGKFTPREGGEYRMLTSCTEASVSLKSDLYVTPTEKERIGLPARSDVLEEIANVTNGEMAQADGISNLVEKIAALPEREPEILEHPLWSDPLWGGGIIVLLGVFWTARKFAGLA